MIDNKYLQKYIDKCNGNVFEATMMVASLARSLANKYDNRILHSEALTWILTGERPNIIDDDGNIKQKCASLSYLDDILFEVDDDEVCKCVRCSIAESNRSQNLVYMYNNITDEPRKARVRVLCRMIWYKTHAYSS